MPPELRVRPDQLRVHAATAARLADELRSSVTGPVPADPAADRLRIAVQRAARELDDLSAALGHGAFAAAQAERTAVGALRRVR